MATLPERPDFIHFGPSLLAPQTRGDSHTARLPADRAGARALLRQECPRTPGVYGWLNGDGQLIYVGKSKSLRSRLLSYFAKTPSDPKMARIRQHSTALVWEPISDELLALLREQELIYRWRPDFNSQGQPTKRQPGYLCLSNSRAPHAFVAKTLSVKSLHAYGPIAGTQHLRDSALALNYVFQLRDCSDKTKFDFGQQLKLFDESQRADCLRFELGNCPGPCRALCSRDQYQRGLRRAVDFLEGRGVAVLDQLHDQMNHLASRQQFERAAILRDRWRALERLDRHLQRVRTAERTINGILTVSAHRGRDIWLVLRQGRLLAHIIQPRSERQWRAAYQTIERLKKVAMEPATNLLDINLQLIIAGWFRKYPQTAERLISFDQAGERCQLRLNSNGRECA